MVSSEHTVSDSSTLTGWYKSSYSGGDTPQGNCLEVARGHSTVPVRDSKRPAGPALVFSGASWAAFVAAVRGGELGA
ncbi:hypothetical protein ADL22_07470 [Streptomyces sp. NRRL F-4489]|uniref:DUF397 domain-containing protein n=1 Tax=Streptomyces sp. NRRL F-4489 TaxID=1609095 RepID=UPI000746D509|nr:DUF397 domain-containing protein [Streptomyces sp. NRRL F-4489]KUL50237.1 hypothetical protein ADL22_07470 [Streptomyces sp. NRRL F-4489]